jgi:hypothetical protein
VITLSTSSQVWTVIGVALNAVGVILLFRFGMPYRERRGGSAFLIVEVSQERKKAEDAYTLLGLLGLACIIVGSGLQIVGALLTPAVAWIMNTTPEFWTAFGTVGLLAVAVGAFIVGVFQLEAAKVERTANLIAATRYAERMRLTDKVILQMVKPKVAIALNKLQGHGTVGDMELARQMFATMDLTAPVESREEPGKSYMGGVGIYLNLFDRIATYAKADLIDEKLFFSQYDWTISYLYFLLSPYVWEPGAHVPTPVVSRFATRAFLYLLEDADKPAVSSDFLNFYSERARKYYPGPETERVLAFAKQKASERM